jgi:hypothetical protein
VPFVMLYRLEGQQLYLFIKNKVRDKQWM